MKIITRLLLHNVCKQRNIDTLMRMAHGFGCAQVIVAGRKKTETMMKKNESGEDDENHADDDDEEEEEENNNSSSSIEALPPIDIKCFKFFSECAAWLKVLPNHVLVGIEIDAEAVAANKLREKVLSVVANRSQQDSNEAAASAGTELDETVINVTFLPGSEGQGILPSERKHCDVYCFVPQFEIFSRQGGGAGSLNVATAVSIVLSEFFSPTPTSSQQQHFLSQHVSDSLQLLPSNFELVPAVFYQSDASLTPGGPANDSGYVHFLMRPATSFGAHTLGVVVAGSGIAAGKVRVSHNRSGFGRNMRKEQHCNVAAFASVLQFVREIKEAQPDRRVFVIGVVSQRAGSEEEEIFDLRSSQLNFPCENAAEKGLALVVVFGRKEPDGLALSPGERSHCNMVVNARKYLLGVNHSVPCCISVILHSLALRLPGLVRQARIGGIAPPGADDAEHANKFSVALRSDVDEQQQKAARERITQQRAAARAAECNDELGGLFG